MICGDKIGFGPWKKSRTLDKQRRLEKSIPGKDKGIGEVMEVKLYFVDIFNK